MSAVTAADVGANLTLAQAGRGFLGDRNARVLAVAVPVALAARLSLGQWSGSDAAVAAAMLALQPFVEWLIHVFVLHFRPRRLAGRVVDLPVARKHRAHHRDPRDLQLVFIPFPDFLALVVGIPTGFLLLESSLAAALTGVSVGYALLATYEWTHYLIHSNYRPRGRYYRYVRRAHRLHHYKNEQYWFGITVHAADHVLRTFPAKDAVPASPTARTLGLPA